jgi:deazaflavin-dependent oxidoreductase (nitroreductase family)
VPKPPPADSPFWKVFGVITTVNTKLFQATNGRVGGGFGKVKLLLLHHVGRKSGRQRVTPLIYLRDDDRLVIVASKGGSDKHPAWFHNLMANPDTRVELPGEKRAVRAREATEAERAGLWPRLVDMYRPYESYQTYTDRKIPLVVLEHVAPQ